MHQWPDDEPPHCGIFGFRQPSEIYPEAVEVLRPNVCVARVLQVPQSRETAYSLVFFYDPASVRHPSTLPRWKYLTAGTRDEGSSQYEYRFERFKFDTSDPDFVANQAK